MTLTGICGSFIFLVGGLCIVLVVWIITSVKQVNESVYQAIMTLSLWAGIGLVVGTLMYIASLLEKVLPLLSQFPQ